MSKSGKLIIPVIFLLIFGLIGCNSAPVKNETATGGTLNYVISGSPPTLDPALTTNTTARDIDNQIYEGLMALNSKGEPVPMLASKVDTSDNQTYTFMLRQG